MIYTKNAYINIKAERDTYKFALINLFQAVEAYNQLEFPQELNVALQETRKIINSALEK